MRLQEVPRKHGQRQQIITKLVLTYC